MEKYAIFSRTIIEYDLNKGTMLSRSHLTKPLYWNRYDIWTDNLRDAVSTVTKRARTSISAKETGKEIHKGYIVYRKSYNTGRVERIFSAKYGHGVHAGLFTQYTEPLGKSLKIKLGM